MDPGDPSMCPISGKDGKCAYLRSPPNIMCTVRDIRKCKTAPLIHGSPVRFSKISNGKWTNPMSPKIKPRMSIQGGDLRIRSPTDDASKLEGGWPDRFKEFLQNLQTQNCSIFNDWRAYSLFDSKCLHLPRRGVAELCMVIKPYRWRSHEVWKRKSVF